MRKNYIMKRSIIPYNPKLKQLARNLRNNSTKSEIMLWQYLKGKQMLGYDFHRQKPIDNYILDFFCNELMLGIELDGYTHTLEETYKKAQLKEKRMSQLGITILRFDDMEVYQDIGNVLLSFESWIQEKKRTDSSTFQDGHTPDPSQEGKKNNT